MICVLLTAVMLFSGVPLVSFAGVQDLTGNTSDENQAILSQLSNLTGGDSDQAYALLKQLGLLDADGNLNVDQSIDLDGKSYTLDELMTLLDDPNTDLTQTAYVDGTPVALGDLKTMVQIERELERIQSTYFTGQTFTSDQIDALNSLLDQIDTQGITANIPENLPAIGGGQPGGAPQTAGDPADGGPDGRADPWRNGPRLSWGGCVLRRARAERHAGRFLH